MKNRETFSFAEQVPNCKGGSFTEGVKQLNLIMDSKLLCKTQLSINEPGEFTIIGKMSAAEVIQLAEQFPWEENRKNVTIDVTTASITLENIAGNYLKLALSYNGKFVLYYYDNKSLFKKIIPRLQEAYEDINHFFETNTIGPGFKKENTIFQHPVIHFQTKSFLYKYQKKFIYYTDWYTRIVLPVFLVQAGYFLFEIIPAKGLTSGLFVLLFFLFVFPLMGGLNLLLSIRYYKVFKNLEIVLSKGADSFQYGTEKINKSEIADITILRNKSNRCPWSNYSLTRIALYDNRELDIPSTLIDYYTILHKFPSIKINEKFDFAPFPRTKPIN